LTGVIEAFRTKLHWKIP